MTQDPSPAPIPAAFNGNGQSAAARQTADGVTAIAGMLSQLPQATGQAVAQAIPRQLCAQCVITRLAWEAKHAQEIAGASAEYQRAAEEATAQGVPFQRPPESFLPGHLQPGQPEGMPVPQPGITTVNGTLVCAGHVPGAPGKPGAKTLLVVNAPLSSSMLAGLSG